MTQALSKEWYTKLQDQAAANFINLPIKFQVEGYDYSFISKSYYTFFNSESNTRQDKLKLAQKFLKFTRSINKNRAVHELDEYFFKCFEYFMDNFRDLMSKQDNIHLETLSVIEQAIDKSAFIEDIVSIDDLKRRVDNLEQIKEKEEIITIEWEGFEDEYARVNEGRSKFLPEHTSNT
jgi:hypothetical protein